MMGATITMLKRRGSCRSSRNSFLMMCPNRFMSGPLPPDSNGRQSENRDGVDHERDHVWPEIRRTHPLENDAPQRDQEVARRDDARHHLEESWHTRNREDE